MASRLNDLLKQNPAWRKMGLNELVELMARRTGLDKREIRRALEGLEDTSVYFRSRGSAGRKGLFGNRKSRRRSRR